MPAHSGAITGTKAHQHSAPSADGGFLSDNITGRTGASNGSLVMYDGGSIAQDLAAGNLNDVLTMGAAQPAWSPPSAASSAVELLGSVELVAPNADLNLTFTSTSFADVSSIDVYYSAFSLVSNDWNITINGLVGTNYVIQRNRQINGSLTSDEVTRPNINTPVIEYAAGHLKIICQDPSTTAGNYNYMFFFGEQSGYDDSTGQDSYVWYSGHYSANTVTAIDEINIRLASGDLIQTGATCSAYKTNKT